ncbi:hypothetical protein [Gordonia sp. SCSIO 19800]|uniref:hypothetical protein n=1 Tax=Gordonia sp. SCSIO 19800 TaxID=2826926 RepID=UPI002010EB6D|nr:hypothetical protein [Gordonia sp. SCSIO 19800]
MTVYATDVDQVFATMRETLVHRVAGDVTDTTARLELAAVVEAIDNLVGRIDWDAERVTRSVSATDRLAEDLGVGDVPGDGIEGLRERRRAVSAAIAQTYRDPKTSSKAVDAILRFTDDDVREQISAALRSGLPG